MTTMLLAAHDGQHLDPQTAHAVTAALALRAEVHVLVAGAAAPTIAREAAQLSGVSLVIVANNTELAHQSAVAVAHLAVMVGYGYSAFVGVAGSTGKDVMPRLAALFNVPQVSDVVSVLAPDIFVHPIYAGNALETVQVLAETTVITVRASAFAATPNGGNAVISEVAPPWVLSLGRVIAESSIKSDRPELSSARVVVSGGRAFGSKEKFDALLMPLAEKLNAAIGASRAAVDAGYASNELQVGQTGRVVAPDLYIACGISGAIQHLAGMKESTVIVAINSDPSAPIFAVADYGLVGDIFEILPALTAAL